MRSEINPESARHIAAGTGSPPAFPLFPQTRIREQSP